jgi:hypothetical protein
LPITSVPSVPGGQKPEQEKSNCSSPALDIPAVPDRDNEVCVPAQEA